MLRVSGERTSPGNIPEAQFRITEDVELGKGGEVRKFNDNLAAIRMVRQLEEEGRRATPEEQRILARYVGWGGLANAFQNPLTQQYKPGWQARGEELRALLSDEEYRKARNSTRNAHYTSETVVSAMWKMVERLGFKGGLVLEPSMGTGNFLGLVPQGVDARFIGVEYDGLTARIARALYPQAEVMHSGFQDAEIPDGRFALNIGNPPFGSESLTFRMKPELSGLSIHNQFFLAGMDALQPGGLQAMVVSRYLMDAQDSSTRARMAEKAELVAAFRLPGTAFAENARTEVVTDILLFRKHDAATARKLSDAAAARAVPEKKRTPEEQALVSQNPLPSWVNVGSVPDPLGGEEMTVGQYFVEHPENVIGTMDRSGTMRGKADVGVRLDDPATLRERLDAAVKRLPRDILKQDESAAKASAEMFERTRQAMKLAASGLEPGHVALDADGGMTRIIERESGEGYERVEQTITAESPWHESLVMDERGRWTEVVPILNPETGKPQKAEGGRRNLTERRVYAHERDVPASRRLGKTNFDRLKRLVRLRDLMKRQLELESGDAIPPAMEAHRKKLRDAYQAYVKAHGYVNRPTSLRLLFTMPDGGLVAALETKYQSERKTGANPRPEKAEAAQILRERAVFRPKRAEKSDSPADALAVTLSEQGRVDMRRIAQLLSVTPEEAAVKLQAGGKPLVFFDPETSSWETSDNYLTGQVKRKLMAAREQDMEMNVKALEAVQPPSWGAEAVTPALGATWIPSGVYADFLSSLVGTDVHVTYSKGTNLFDVTAKNPQKSDLDIPNMSVSDLFLRTLNSLPVTVRTKDADGKSVIDHEMTKLAQMNEKALKAQFADWVFADGSRRDMLVALFNDKYNTRVNRQYDGSHMAFPGKVPDAVLKLRRHQVNGIWRGVYERFVLYDHVVGAGKTFTAISRIMERRRMGLSRKPMVAVPNHLVGQWEADVYRMYPGARVMAMKQKDFEGNRRRRALARIATGDFDIAIVPHSSFGFIDIAPETKRRYLNAELEEAKEEYAAAKKEGGRLSVKEAERVVTKLQEQIAKLENKSAKDRLLTFEQMGVDDLTVDEAHLFKNLRYSSRLTGVRGMGSKTGSGRANDLYNKIRVLREQPDGSVAFLSGTPISNSAVEMYTVLRYLAADELEEMGLSHFDAFRNQFVEASTAFEPTESGGLKEVTRLGRSWNNMRMLMDLYYQIADAVSLENIKEWHLEDFGEDFPIPRVAGGKDRRLVVVKPTPAQARLLDEVGAGYDALELIRDPHERNKVRLRLSDKARKVSLDARAVDPGIPGEAGGKIGAAVENIERLYRKWEAEKGAQLVFLDRSVPKQKGDDERLKKYDALRLSLEEALQSGDESVVARLNDRLDEYDTNAMEEMRNAVGGGWNAYQQIKEELVAKGIPEHEVRFIHEARSDEEKKALFDAVNAGDVRVLIGSTERMGAGTNVQERLVGLHHVDVTWKPSDIEQREGRIIRQGNKLLEKYGREAFEVEVIAYATERTVDAKMWDLNATKLKMINAIRMYDGAFNMDFLDEASVSMAEIAAIASGDPMLLERVQLESEIEQLELQERAHRRKRYAAQDALRKAEWAIRDNPRLIEAAKEEEREARSAIDALEASARERSVKVEGREYQTPAAALLAAQKAVTAQQGGKESARYAVNVAGKKLTTQDDIRNAVSAALGDEQAFSARIDGTERIQRNVAAREVAQMVNAEWSDNGGKAEAVPLGEMLGYTLEADMERNRLIEDGAQTFQMTLSLVDGDGRTVASHSTAPQAGLLGKPHFGQANVRPVFERLVGDVRELADGNRSSGLGAALEKAKKELPELRARAEEAFPKADELKAKRDRLKEVIALKQEEAGGGGESAPNAAEAVAGNGEALYQEAAPERDPFKPDPYDARAFAEAVARISRMEHAPNTTLTVGDTPAVLRALGARDVPLQIAPSVIHKANREKHNVPVSVLQNLPALLADPIAVFDSHTEQNALVALVEAQDESGRPVVIAVHLDAKGSGYNRVNKIASVYGRNDAAQTVFGWFQDGSTRYFNAKKTADWLHEHGLQLPVSNTDQRSIKNNRASREEVNEKAAGLLHGAGRQLPVANAIKRLNPNIVTQSDLFNDNGLYQESAPEQPLSLDPVRLTLEGWRGTASELSALAREVYTRELQGTTVENASLGATVAFTSEGRGEAFGARGKMRSTVRAELARVLREIVRRAAKVGESAPRPERAHDSRAFHTLVAPLEVNGEAYAAKVTVREALNVPNGDTPYKFYDVTSVELKGRSPDVHGSSDQNSPRPAPVRASQVSIDELARVFNIAPPGAASPRSTPEQVRAALARKLGAETVAALESSGALRIHATGSEAWDAVREGRKGQDFSRYDMKNATRAVIAHGGAEVVLVKTKGKNGWMLTGYEVKPGARSAGSDAATATHASPIRSRESAGAGSETDNVASAPPEVKPEDVRELRHYRNAEGMFDRETGTVHLVAENLDAGKVSGTLLHELWHQYLNGIRDTKKWRTLMNRLALIEKMLAKGEGGKWFAAANARISARDRADEARRLNELAAYAVTEYENAPRSLPQAVAKWVQDFIADIRAFLIDRVGFVPQSLTAADFAALARRQLAEGAKPDSGGLLYQEGEPQKSATVVDIDPAGIPVDWKNTRELVKWVRDEYQGKEVVIRSDGTIQKYGREGLESGAKRRGETLRAAFSDLSSLLENAVFDHFEVNDRQEKHAHLKGQRVYYAAMRIGTGLYSVKFKLDMPLYGEKAHYKDHKVVGIDIAPAPYAGGVVPGLLAPADLGTAPSAVSAVSMDVLTGNVKSSGITDDGLLYQEIAPVDDAENFRAMLESFGRGELKSGTILQLGNAGRLLQRFGIPEQPIEMTQSVLREHLQKHRITLEQLRDLPEQLQKPIAVFDSAHNPKTAVLLTEIRHTEGNLAVVIEVNKERNKLVVNDIRSVHPKSDQKVLNWVQAGLLRGADEKRGLHLLSTTARSNSTREEKNKASDFILYDAERDFNDNGIFYQESAQSKGAADASSDPGGFQSYARAATESVLDSLNALAQSTFGNSTGKLSWWHKTVGSMYNLAHRDTRQGRLFKPVFTAAQDFIQGVSHYGAKAGESAPNLLPRLEGARDILRPYRVSAEDAKKIAAPIFNGTLEWIRDETGRARRVEEQAARMAGVSTADKVKMLERHGKIHERTRKEWESLKPDDFEKKANAVFETAFLSPGLVWTDAELSGMWRLTRKQIGLYREYRAAIDKSLDNLTRSEMLRLLGKDGAEIQEAVMEAESLDDAQRIIDDHAPLEVADTAARMRDRALSLKAHGYAPLSRFGSYSVTVYDKDTGDVAFFSLFETLADQKRMAEAMRAEYPDAEVESGTLSQEAFRMFKGISPETLEIFGDIAGIGGSGDAEQDAVFQKWLQMAKSNRSAMKRLIHRKGTAGFSQDVGRGLASFIYSNARATSAAINMGSLFRAVAAIPKEEGELRDAAERLRQYVSDPEEEASGIKGLLFAQYLGGSVASAAVNMTQPCQVTFPWLTQYGGARQAMAQVARAARDIAGRSPLEAALASAMKKAEEDGVVAPQEIHQMMRQARGKASLMAGDGTRSGDARAALNNAWMRVTAGWGLMFSAAEQVNRRITYVAAFRNAKGRGLSDGDADAFARQAINETQFVYSKASKGRFQRGAVGGVLMTFKTYSIAYVELANRLWNAGPEGRRAAACMAAMLLLAAGAGGLPFMEDAEDVIDALAQLMGKDFSTKQTRRAFLGDFLDTGVTGLPGMPLDVSGRLGMGNMIPGTGFLLKKQDHSRDATELIGPAGDLAARVFSGSARLLRGDVAGAALEVSPGAVRNVAKGADMIATGNYRDSRGYNVVESSAGEAFAKMAGFQPYSASRVQETAAAVNRSKYFYQQEATEIRMQWAQAIYEQDAEGVEDARERIREWNKRNPGLPMRIRMPDVWRRVREMRKPKAERTTDATPRAIRAAVRESFAQM